MSDLAAEAAGIGFDAIAVTTPDAVPVAGQRLRTWVADGRHGEMAWMAERIDWRASPAALWPEARSVILLADSYAPEHDPLETLGQPEHAAISVYAKGKDYHDVVKKRLKRLGRWLIERAGADSDNDADTRIKVFVDTAPVMEKPLAAAAGLGSQAKHTNLEKLLSDWNDLVKPYAIRHGAKGFGAIGK